MQGRRLGHYEITAKLGAGGMGEVYRATDTKLKREVAIKVLPQAFTADADRLVRFEREAQMLAQLHHPRIASIFGLEESSGVRGLVMELVEGPTLAERLEPGALPLDEALAIARQIAEALEAAHEKGIVHRDLKPQNVKVTAGGQVKVLDFGLAKAMDPLAGAQPSAGDAPLSPSLMASPTLTLSAEATQPGVILGTAAYMSPEQARGEAVDQRTDIWAFGVVLWKMLSGRTLFAGPTVSDTLAAVLKVDPDPRQLPVGTPAKVRHLLQRCLRKDPRDRLRSIADARLVVEEVERGELDEVPAAGAAAAARWSLGWVAAALAAAVVLGALATVAIGRLATPAPAAPRVVRFEIPPPEKLVQVGAPKISPDGRHVAFAAREESGTVRVWLRSLDSTEARPLSGTDGAILTGRPFWAPDSRQVAYFAGEKLYRVPIDGGPPQKIADANGADATWSEQDLILFDVAAGAPIRGVSAAGGVPKTVVTSRSRESDGYEVGWPQFLPGGRRFLYVVISGVEEQNGIWMAAADGTQARRLVAGLSRAEFAPPGWLLFVRESTLVAQRLDIEAGELSGEPIPVADGLDVSNVGLAEFSVSRAGVLVYRAGGGGLDQLSAYDRRGVQESPPIEAGRVSNPAFSPDGRWLAFDREEGGGGDIWLRDLRRGVTSRFTFARGLEWSPVFSLDGERIFFSRDDGKGRWAIVSRSLGDGAEITIHRGETIQAPVAVAPDGRHLLIAQFPQGQGDLYVLDLEHPEHLAQLTATPEFSESRAGFSPDGRWLAYESDESGQAEIYVRPFPGPGRSWQVSTAGGSFPIWAPGGREIFYRDAAQRLTRVEVQAGASFDAGVPEPLFALPLGAEDSMRKIAISPNGERFVAVVPAAERTAPPTSVIVGWDASLPK
jgi:Tol biopolymer transport system component